MKRFGYWLVISLGCIQYSQAQTTVSDTILNKTIQDIEVWGRHFSGISGGTIKQLHVENSPSTMNVTTSEAFRQLPSVITDIEGGVTYRGSNKSNLLIDGIPYGLLEEYSGDVLIQLPSLFFNRITLSSFPAIDYVPDGDAGVLNLSSSVSLPEESPLSITLGGGLHNRYNVGTVLNLNQGKFYITAKYNYRREFRSRKFDKSTTTTKNTTVMNNNADARPDIHLADLSMAYDLTSQDQLGVHGLYHTMSYSRYGKINNQIYNPKGELMKHVLRNRYNDQRQDAYAAEVYWNHYFQTGGLLSARFNYNNFTYDEDNDFKNENPENGQIIAEDNQFINHDKHNYFWKLHYVRPLANNFRLNTGYIGRSTQEIYHTDVNAKQNGEWQANPAKSYQYEFNRYLNLLFLSLDKRADTWEGEIGLQAEFNKRVMQEAEQTKLNSFHLYPRARFTYRPNDNQSLTIGYQQRVIRPLGSELNSYLDNSDATHVFLGNPELKDEYIHSLELGYQLAILNVRINPALYYRNRTNRIVEVAQQNEEETVWQKMNVGNSQAVGADISVNWQPFHFLQVGIAGNVFRDEIDGRTIGYGEKKSLWCWDAKGNAEIRITPTTILQIDGFYISDQLTPQGKIKNHYTVNAGLSQYLLQKKLCLNLSISNIFDSLGEKTIISTDQLQMIQERNRDARVCWLTLTYRL